MTVHVNSVNATDGQFLSESPEMATPTKGNTLRLYLRDEELVSLQKLTEVLEIPQTEIMSRIMTAGIRAIQEAGNRMPLPLKFEIKEGDPPSKPLTKTRR